jgi:hypothetical protein
MDVIGRDCALDADRARGRTAPTNAASCILRNDCNDAYREVRPSCRQRLAGAVSLTDEQWERVLWWLHKPVLPGPAKALDETIICAINAQRGQ